MSTRGSVLVIYEDATSRDAAVKFCDCMVERFWRECAFEVNWISFDELSQREAASLAAERARNAGVLVVALSGTTDLPHGMHLWIQDCLEHRSEAEGILAGLIEGDRPDKHACLRDAAHRANMDYITAVPQNLSRAIPDSLESYSARADQVTTVLDEILQQRPLTGESARWTDNRR